MDTPADVVKRFISNFEHKQRNLLKRKGKLDQYRDKLSNGEVLNDEQKKAADSYESVLQNLTMVQEVIAQSKEMVDDIDDVVSLEHSKREKDYEQHTISFLSVHSCLLRLLENIDSETVMSSIVKSTSENHLKMLLAVRDMVIAPLPNKWPGTSSASLEKAPEFLQNQSEVNLSAQFTYDFVMGKSNVIHIPGNDEGSHKKFTMREARMLCFRLLATPAIRQSLCPNYPVNCISPALEDEHAFMNQSTINEVIECHSTENTVVNDGHNPPTIRGPLSDASPIMLDEVIRPLGGTFNFLQASSVIPSSIPHTHATVKSQITSERFNETQSVESLPMNIQPMIDNPENNERLQERFNASTCNASHQTTSLINDETVEIFNKNNLDEAIMKTNCASSKPISYADLVRRSGGRSRPSSTTNNEQRIAAVLPSDRIKTDNIPSLSSETENIHEPGSMKLRGGRGLPRSGPTTARRGMGGQRGHRFIPGRGACAYRGSPTTVAQPSY